MCREQHGNLGGNVAERFEDPAKRLGFVDVGRPVQGHKRKGIGGQAEPLEHRRCARLRQVAVERVDHGVPDEVDPLPVDPLMNEVPFRLGRGREQQVAQLIGQDAVDLLRHAAIERPEARFDVRNG